MSDRSAEDENIAIDDERQSCRRTHDRDTTELPGRIILNDACSYDCTIHNTSPAGARLHMSEEHYVPPRFDLEIDGQKQVITCRRAWQSGTEIGAHFISALVLQLPLPPAPPPEEPESDAD